jgi:hypothetical protein
LRPRIGRLSVKPSEVLAVLVTLLFLSGVVYYYYSRVRPAAARLEQTRQRFDEQLKTITGQNQAGSDAGSRILQIALAKESLSSFKGQQLKPLKDGRRAIFDEINGLAKKHGVELTSGIQMQRGGKSEEETAKKASRETVADLVEVYPNLEMKFAVAGSYDSLRKLLNELERSKQYVVLNEINLTAVEETEGRQSGRRGRSGGQAIALNVSMKAYFQP